MNLDWYRLFVEGKGTPVVSPPIIALDPICFGGHYGKHRKPRAEFELDLRYISSTTSFRVPSARTNIMPYGFTPGEKKIHKDVRLLVPAPVREISVRAGMAGLPTPQVGNVVLLEWPTLAVPAFRMTFMEPGSPLFIQAETVFNHAVATGHLVGGREACWLLPGLAPPW